MHLRVSIVLLFILLTGGFSLDCYDCQGPQRDSCSQVKTCNDKHKCASTETVDYLGRYRNLIEKWVRIGNSTRLKHIQATCRNMKATSKETFSRSCAMPHECKSWSFSTGCWRRMSSTQCCSTKFCNQKLIQVAPGSTSRKPNGKKCFTCDAEGCSKIMSCWGDENQCFTTKANETLKAVKGCASKSACDRVLGQVLESYGNITCCSGDLCNGAESVTQSFLFLCCSLLSFILLH